MPGWRGELHLRYTQQAGRCLGHARHVGPLRVLKALYPEGPVICHHVVLHPPSGLVGGDELHFHAQLDPGTHAVLTTPGATRFYRSEAALALQHVNLHLAAGARVEWLPMETIAYSGCRAESRLSLHLAEGSEAMAWELLALGLPSSGQPFDKGSFQQHLEIPGRWLERGRLRADDTSLLDGAPGLAGRRVLGSLCLAAGTPWPPARQQALLDAARVALATHPLAAWAGVTSPLPGVLLLRVLGQGVEAAMQLLADVRAAWRQEAWGLSAQPPRIWRT